MRYLLEKQLGKILLIIFFFFSQDGFNTHQIACSKQSNKAQIILRNKWQVLCTDSLITGLGQCLRDKKRGTRRKRNLFTEIVYFNMHPSSLHYEFILISLFPSTSKTQYIHLQFNVLMSMHIHRQHRTINAFILFYSIYCRRALMVV